MSKKNAPTPNDQRSVVKSPTSPAYQADRQNREAQGHSSPPATPAPAPKKK